MSQPLFSRAAIVNVKFGHNVKVVEPVNLYGCEIGDDTFIGPFTEIQNGVLIGANTRIQSHTFICTGVTVGNNCFIGHGVMFVNDRFRDGKTAGSSEKWEITQIGNGVLIGSNCTIMPVSICEGAVIGAGAVVTKDITVPGTYAGNPAVMLTNLSSSDPGEK